MARTIAIWGPTGLATPTLKLMLRSALTTVVETITLTEHGTVKQLYTGTVTAAAGDYRFNLLTAGSYIGSGTITVSGTDGTTSEEDSENTITTTLSSIVTTLAAMAATVWSYATRTLTGSAQSVGSSLAAGASVTTYRDSTWSVTLTGLGVLTGWTKLLVTLRTDPNGTDAESLVQIQLSSPGAGSDGLLYINGAAAGTAANGSITVNDAVTGSITIALAAVEAAKLTHQKTKYDVKKFSASGATFMSTEGVWQIKASPTRTVA